MATESSNGPSADNGMGSELSPAQKLMLKHDDAHKATVEEVPDEDDLKHGELPKSSSVLESVDDATTNTSWGPSMSAKAAGKQKAQDAPSKENRAPLDTQSHELFPELGSGPKGPAVAPTWGGKKSSTPGTNGNTNGNGASANGLSRGSTPVSGIATPTSNGNQGVVRSGLGYSTIPGRNVLTVSLQPGQILPRAQMKKPLPDILRDISKKTKVTVSTHTGESGVIHFNATGPEKACKQALKDVIDQIGAKQSIKVPIPRSSRAHIIGKQGSTIKALQEKTGAKIQMPKVEESNDKNDYDDEDDTVFVVIEGNAHTTEMARQEIMKIAGDRTPTINQKLRGIPAEFYPFLAGPKNSRVSDMEQGKNIRVHIPVHHTWTKQPPPQVPAPGELASFLPALADNHIMISGDRHAVQEARAEIERQAEELRQLLTLEQLSINKGRHQFIVGERGIPIHDFLEETGCAIILPSDDDDEIIHIIGPADQIQSGVEKAMDLASSMQSTHVDISRQYRNAPGGAGTHARDVTRYLQRRKEIERLEKLHNAHIVTPHLPDGFAPWELYSRDGKNAIRAQSEITGIVNGHPPSRVARVNVDPFFHPHLQKDIMPRVQKEYGVYTVVPDDSDNSAPVLLVFEGPDGADPEYQVSRTQPSPAEVQAFKQALAEAEKYIMDIIGAQEEITTQSIDVPQRFHPKLRKFILKEQESRSVEQIPVRVTSTGTVVTLRGTKSAVDSLADKVNAFIEQEIADDKERGFTMAFDFPQKHANQLIGKGGSKISELRDKFDVEIQVNDGKVELKGPKAKAEAAKAHITSLGKQWADETTHVLKIEPKFHRELIGAQGTQINKLQTRYKVQINFPRSARPVQDDQSVDGAASEATGPRGGRRNQAEDEVMVRGPSKGADEARDEILSLLQYLKDNSHSAVVSVQQSQISSLIGQRGKSMDELRQLTGAKIDIPGSRDAKDPSGLVDITIRGTKAQVAQAKKIIEEKRNLFDQTVSKSIEIDKKHHSVLIGPGGSSLRDIIIKAGGPEDPREHSRAVQFPRAGADGNMIKVEGNQDVVDKIIASFKEIVAQRDTQVSEILEIPTEKHRTLIGRGGDTKKDLETKLNVSIDIPRRGSSETGVKISGQPADVEKAKAHIAAMVKDDEGETVQVPRKFHHAISENGQFFRKLKNDHGVNVDHAGQKLPPRPAAPTHPGTNGGSLPLITDNQETSADAHSWQVVRVAGSDLEGDIPWILRGPEPNIAKAKAAIASALEQAQQNTTTGYLVLPDPRTHRFVIGQSGSQINGIRKQTGCRINVPKNSADNDAIEINGSEEGVEKARELILKAVKEGSANGNRG